MRRWTHLAAIIVLAMTCRSWADDAPPPPLDPRYAALPDLTDDQKAKIVAIEQQADTQVRAILTDEQKTALENANAAAAAPAGSGLYSSEAAAMTSGPIKSRDYWQAKFNAEQLEQAIKDHQPEGAIALQLVSAGQLLDGLLAQYPKHTELLSWRARVTQVQNLIGDNFDRTATFKAGCLWDQDSYMQSYVGYNTAKMAMADKDYELAFMMSGLAKQKVDYLTESDDHMADYPDSAKEYIRRIKPEVEQMYEDSGKESHHL